MKKRGEFIVIEGIDGSGKTRQFKLLEQRLRSIKNKLITTDFPRYYESKWGELVGRFLTGEFGKLEEVNPLSCRTSLHDGSVYLESRRRHPVD